MAGRPKLNALRRQIANLEEGEDWVFQRVIDGWAMGKIADELGCSRGLLYDWLGKGPDEDVRRRKQKLEMARKLSAEALEEEGGRILDDLADEEIVTGTDVRLAEARAKYRQWQAESRDKERYGKGSQGTPQLNIGELHLHALKEAGSMSRRLGVGDSTIREADVEVVEEDDEDDDVLQELMSA